jgi:hypothetical protein
MGARDPETPGHEAPPGAPGAGENLCGGTSAVYAETGPECQGTGKVTTRIGAA